MIAVRASCVDDGSTLRAIEEAAGARFRDVGLEHVAEDEPLSIEALGEYAAAGRSWVAVDDGGEPVGYVLVQTIGGGAHIEQLSVRPNRQGLGVGRALLSCVRRWAVEQEMSSVTLTTFNHVTWNRPLFEHLGFRALAHDELGPALLAVRRAEADRGLDPDLRSCMRWDLQS